MVNVGRERLDLVTNIGPVPRGVGGGGTIQKRFQAAWDSKIHSKTETRVQRDSSANGVVPKSQTKSDRRVVM